MNPGILTLACSTCANNFSEAGGNAAGLAILFMLCMIVPVCGAIGFFMVRIARREMAGLDPEFCDPPRVAHPQKSHS